MSPSSSRPALPRALREALADLVKLKLPPGKAPTLDDYEAAAVQVLQELGPTLLEDAIQGIEADPKKGALPGAAAAPCSTKSSSRGRSSR
jgi:hypothetical protein